ncbi:DUF169 domain-containing protein [Fundidesulfovibrio terrae]|uniref:DUF169 domain-containing protein n=1 Tax=Fundidesulfovibrio terrae TaxID=2922866 RepID=UPI001FAF0EE7|nr:DUF169 domain-containing protein [Fundidesulfovibrio terrae]
MDAPLKAFLDALGHDGEPFGMFYTDREPQDGFSPKPGPPVSAELEQAGKMDWQAVWGSFSCVMGNIWLARKKKSAAYFESARYGCMGGSFYLGFHQPQLDFLTRYVSSGIPGTQVHGERYLDSPETVRRLFTEIPPRPAPARFCVFKPVSRFEPDETPETVTFFGRPEVLAGLGFLASFVTGDFEAVMSPFGAGCACMTTWPFHYLKQGRLKAVLGGFDPSERKFLKTDEMTFTVPYEMFTRFLARWEESYLTTDTWAGVRKKVARSSEAWGESAAASGE